MSPADTDIPKDIHEKYEVHETRHAAAILVHDFEKEWADVRDALNGFVLRRSHILAPGGGKSNISQYFDDFLTERGWKERQFKVDFVVDDIARESNTHKIDCFKERVGLEIEWNSKDQTFVRDLNNYRLLFDIGTISVGIIITRCDELQGLFKSLNQGAKYGASTTHMSKLLPRLAAGGGGGCPILVFGIRRLLYDANQ